MSATSDDVKVAAHLLIDALPKGATWDDVMYRVYVRQCIDSGMDDLKNGCVIDVEEVRERFGLKR
jgi:hypothetical protein